ncbi:hypothetical protein [Lonepinella sp. BR2357]|uniref:hypothetical protein n=1 Tax=Lonepinella sp. BR2357 TaxID=3434549 RepID=UPI003F6DD897
MTKQISITKIKDNFIDDINKSRALVKEMQRLQQNKSFVKGGHKYVEQVVGLAFSSVVSSWENFLGNALLRYMTGRIIPKVPVKTEISGIKNLDVAFRILLGSKKFKSLKESYLDYNSLSKLKEDADIFLKNHPFIFNTEDKELIENMNKIRNRVAHSSDKCKEDFKAVAKKYFKTTTLRQGISVGSFLLKKTDLTTNQGLFTAKQLSELSNATSNDYLGNCIFEVYLTNLEKLAKTFVPY